jgi:uncharacterized lipoprotein YajG
MKVRGMFAVAPLLLIAGCASQSPEQALTAACEEAATTQQESEYANAEVASNATDSTQRAAADAYDVTGVTTVSEDGSEVTFNWTCFGQRSDGKDYASIQDVARS